MRKAYSAKCNFFADDSSLSNRINWYIVPDGTLVYDQPTVFYPRSDQDIAQGLSPFEQSGIGAIVRQKDDGFDPYGYPGTHVHGDAQDFLGQSLSHKYWIGGDPPVEPCQGIPRGRAPLELAFRRTVVPRIDGPFSVALALQAWIDDAFSARLTLDVSLRHVPPGRPVFDASLALDGDVAGSKMGHGLELTFKLIVTSSDFMLLEDGTSMLVQDGTNMLLEHSIPATMRLEDDSHMLLEDASYMLVE